MQYSKEELQEMYKEARRQGDYQKAERIKKHQKAMGYRWSSRSGGKKPKGGKTGVVPDVVLDSEYFQSLMRNPNVAVENLPDSCLEA